MKAIKITYWITTVLIAVLYAFDAYMFLSGNPMMIASMQSLGYPAYLLTMLGTAKILAVIGLLVPHMPRLREWTYAGIYINMIGAFWSHAAMGQTDKLLPVGIILLVITISYFTYRKMQPAKLSA